MQNKKQCRYFFFGKFSNAGGIDIGKRNGCEVEDGSNNVCVDDVDVEFQIGIL